MIMPFSKKNKIILFLIFLIAIVIIISAIFIVIYPPQNDTEKITKSIREEALLFKDNLPQDTIDKNILVLNNKSLSEKERYQALKEIFFYFDTAYFNLGLPRIRNYVSTLDTYALKTFKNEYQEGDFYIACADYVCGEATPPEIEKLIEKIKKLQIDEVWKNSIILNMRTASHIPYVSDFDKADKLNSYSIAISELVTLANPQASVSANELREYIEKTYNKTL